MGKKRITSSSRRRPGRPALLRLPPSPSSPAVAGERRWAKPALREARGYPTGGGALGFEGLALMAGRRTPRQCWAARESAPGMEQGGGGVRGLLAAVWPPRLIKPAALDLGAHGYFCRRSNYLALWCRLHRSWRGRGPGQHDTWTVADGAGPKCGVLSLE